MDAQIEIKMDVKTDSETQNEKNNIINDTREIVTEGKQTFSNQKYGSKSDINLESKIMNKASKIAKEPEKCEGCAHLDDFKTYKRPISKYMDQEQFYLCQICNSDFQIHVCLDCERMFCFDDLRNHFNDKKIKEDVNKGLNEMSHIKTRADSYDPNNTVTLSDETEIAHGFLTNNFDFMKKTTENTEYSTIKRNSIASMGDNTKHHKSSKHSYSTKNAKSDPTSPLQKYSSDAILLPGKPSETCTGMFLNLKIMSIYCYNCRKYLKFNKLTDQFLQRQYLVKNQRNFSRMQYSYIKGMQNMGNSCYMNAILQIFLNSHIFRSKILDGNHQKVTCTETYCIICSLKGLFIESFSETPCLIPSELLFSFFYRMNSKYTSEQFDSHEFFIDLCDTIHNQMSEQLLQMKTSHSNQNNKYSTCGCIIHSIFNGIIESVIICHKCKHRSVTREEFNSLSICAKSNVQKSFTSFFEDEEVLTDFSCQNCKTKGTAQKNISLTKTPQILCLHIKRYTNNTGKLSKNTDFLELTENLIIEKANKTNQSYGLYGAVCHTGELRNGHYYVYLKRDNFWLRIDDENVSISKYNEISRELSYILFYQI